MSLSAYSSKFPHPPPPDFGGKGGEGGAYLFSVFFLQTTQNAVVLISGLSVLWASNAVLF